MQSFTCYNDSAHMGNTPSVTSPFVTCLGYEGWREEHLFYRKFGGKNTSQGPTDALWIFNCVE